MAGVTVTFDGKGSTGQEVGHVRVEVTMAADADTTKVYAAIVEFLDEIGFNQAVLTAEIETTKESSEEFANR